jgi:hypothetical protein
MMLSRFSVISICGNIRFQDIMFRLARKLETNGNIVLVPFIEKNGLNDDMLDRMYAAKLDLSDILYVVAIDQYIDFCTKKLIAYAKGTKKQVMYIRNEGDIK